LALPETTERLSHGESAFSGAFHPTLGRSARLDRVYLDAPHGDGFWQEISELV
jgi:hypothetical protein